MPAKQRVHLPATEDCDSCLAAVAGKHRLGHGPMATVGFLPGLTGQKAIGGARAPPSNSRPPTQVEEGQRQVTTTQAKTQTSRPARRAPHYDRIIPSVKDHDDALAGASFRNLLHSLRRMSSVLTGSILTVEPPINWQDDRREGSGANGGSSVVASHARLCRGAARVSCAEDRCLTEVSRCFHCWSRLRKQTRPLLSRWGVSDRRPPRQARLDRHLQRPDRFLPLSAAPPFLAKPRKPLPGRPPLAFRPIGCSRSSPV